MALSAPPAFIKNHHKSSKSRRRKMRFSCCLAIALLAVYSLAQEENAVPSFHLGDDMNSPEGLTPHAKQVLLGAARERVNVRDKKDKQEAESSRSTTSRTSSTSNHRNLPPLESLVTKSNQIVADVQFLLDFAVVGFGKCGTTTLVQWLQGNNENSNSTLQVRAPNYEAQFLVNQRPEQLVRKMHQFAVEEQELLETKPTARILKGFKNPSDIRRQKSRDLLTNYWPRTPLIVSVRHPVDWMVSLYNYFKIEKGRHQAKLPVTTILDRGGRDVDGNTHHFVSTAKGEFHAMLAELGKTPLSTTDEWQLLQPWLDPSQKDRIRAHRLPNPLFLLEMNQLNPTNATRAHQLAHDLEAFLGLPRGHLPPAPHVRPKADLVQLSKTDHLKMDICSPENAPVLEEMMAIARAASQWFQQYFLKSPDVTVSSPDHLAELLDQWKINPCDQSQ